MELVQYAADGPVATLTLASPHNRNALSRQLVSDLLTGISRAEEDTAVRAVVLAAEGTVFCSGADLSEAAESGMSEGAAALVELQRRIVASPRPFVARVQGPVRAGGLGLIAASDVAICADTVSFALTEVMLALAPAAISLTVLPRLTSRAASRTFLTGETFSAASAAEIGLVSAAVPADALDAEVAAVTDRLAQGHPQGLRESKRLVNADILDRIDRDGAAMADLSGRLFASEEARTAMRAFLDRKK